MIKTRLTETLENEDLESERSKGRCISTIIDVIGSLNHAINYGKEKQANYTKVQNNPV